MKPTSWFQLALFAIYSYHAFITDRDGDTLSLEADHRPLAESESAIRDLKHDVGLNPLPSGTSPANAAWLDGPNGSGWSDRDRQDPAAARLLLGRRAHPKGPPTHVASDPGRYLG